MPWSRRHCPIDGDKVKSRQVPHLRHYEPASAGPGPFRRQYNITNQFGGTLHEHIGQEAGPGADGIRGSDPNVENGGQGTHLLPPPARRPSKLCLRTTDLLDASVQHLG